MPLLRLTQTAKGGDAYRVEIALEAEHMVRQTATVLGGHALPAFSCCAAIVVAVGRPSSERKAKYAPRVGRRTTQSSSAFCTGSGA